MQAFFEIPHNLLFYVYCYRIYFIETYIFIYHLLCAIIVLPYHDILVCFLSAVMIYFTCLGEEGIQELVD